MAQYTRDEIAQILRTAGIPEKDIPVMVAIAMAESSGNSDAIGDEDLVNDKWNESIGLFQIRSLKNPEQFSGSDKLRVREDLFDPINNAKAAYAISKQGTNWTPWTTFTKGTYKNYMGEQSSRSNMRNKIKVVGKGKGKPIAMGDDNFLNADDDVDLSLAQQIAKKYPELESIWNASLDEDVTDEQLDKLMRSTKFYKTFPEQARKKILLASQDPATFSALQQDIRAQVRQTFETYGATNVDDNKVNRLADRAIFYDLSAEELVKIVADSIDFNAAYLQGIAGTTSRDLQKLASQYGISLPQNSIELKNYTKDVITKKRTKEDITEIWKQDMMRNFPAFKARFDAGATLEDVASPYRDLMSEYLEIPKEQIRFNDKTLLGMMQGINSKDGSPRALSLSEGLDSIKKDPRWAYTKNAQQTILSAMQDVFALMRENQ